MGINNSKTFHSVLSVIQTFLSVLAMFSALVTWIVSLFVPPSTPPLEGCAVAALDGPTASFAEDVCSSRIAADVSIRSSVRVAGASAKVEELGPAASTLVSGACSFRLVRMLNASCSLRVTLFRPLASTWSASAVPANGIPPKAVTKFGDVGKVGDVGVEAMPETGRS